MKAVLCVLFLLVGKVLSADVKPVRGVFESCASCRLNAMPGLRRFLYESILREEYGSKLRVDFISGVDPELILYGPNNEELSREEAPDLSYDELHAFVQSNGFERIKQLPPPPPVNPGRSNHYDIGAYEEDSSEDESDHDDPYAPQGQQAKEL